MVRRQITAMFKLVAKVQAGRTVPFWVLLFISLASMARAMSVAVFPVADLSRGYNSVNFELTAYLRQELAARNIRVVEPQAVIAFMGRNKIRWLGYLDSAHILAVKEELHADLILFGTVSQRRETRSPTFGLTLNMVRTEDARSVWSVSGGLSLLDMQRLLGINEPTSLADLWPALASSLISRLPDDYGELLQTPLLFDKERDDSPAAVTIGHVSLEPKFVRPGEEVRCVVEFNRRNDDDDLPQVYVKVGSRIHLARRTEEGLYYEANWTGSEVEKNIFREVGHSELNFAVKDFEAQVYEGLWPSSVEDDEYPVSLILKWPSGTQETMFVGAYTVDSTPPDFDLKLIGKEIDGLVSFHDKLMMLANFRDREPTSHWQIRIEDGKGKTVLDQEGKGKLPHRFIWQGQGFNGFPVREGIYRIVLEAWDRSGNMKKVDKEVAYRPTPPQIPVEVVKIEQHLSVKLLKTEGLPIDFWQFEIWSSDGELLKMADGKTLPVEYEIPLPDDPDSAKMNGEIYLKDILGNKSRVRIEDLYLIARQHSEPAGKKPSETVEGKDEFDDSWASM